MSAVTDSRKKVALDEREQAILAELVDPARRPSKALRELLGDVVESPRPSEAAMLSVILRLGFERVQDARRAAGYEALAQQLQDVPEEQAERAAMRAHRSRSAAAWAEA